MSEEETVAATIRADLGEEVEIHDSSEPDAVFVTTRSKIELALRNYREGVLARRGWVNPFVTSVTILSVLLVADFETRLGLPATTWYAVFVLALALSLAWLGRELLAYVRNRHRADIAHVIQTLESEP